MIKLCLWGFWPPPCNDGVDLEKLDHSWSPFSTDDPEVHISLNLIHCNLFSVETSEVSSALKIHHIIVSGVPWDMGLVKTHQC